MLTYKIFLNTDMTIRDVISSGNLVQYSWNNISVNVYIPKAIYETSPSISNTVSMTFTQTKENGDTVITNNARLYEFSYVKDNVMVNNIEYVLLTRQMPQQMTLYFGNTQKFQINHLVISDNEIISFAQSPFQRYEVFQASNTQEIHDEPSTVDELQADINNLKRRTEQLEVFKQDKANIDIHVRTDSAVSDDPNHFTTNVTVGLNVLSNRTDDLEIDNKKNKEDIEELKSAIINNFTPLGKMTGNTAEPTLEQINAWLVEQGITNVELGDLIIYVGQVPSVNTNYKCIYSQDGWFWYETTELETASNSNMGVVKGNGNDTHANEAVDIQNGEIRGIKVKDVNGTQRYLKGYINELEDNQDKILDGTTAVPMANKSKNDEAGNDIQATYQTKTLGATKQYVKDYALSKAFNDMNYINFSADSNTIEPTYHGGTKTLTISNIGDVKLFSATYHNDVYEYSLSQNNVFELHLPIMLNVNKTTKLKVVIKLDNGTDTPTTIGTADSSNIEFVADNFTLVTINGAFTSLQEPVKITPTSSLIVDVYIFNDETTTFSVEIANALYQPSSFTLTIPYQTIQIIEGGAVGQQYVHTICTYNETAQADLGVGYVFDLSGIDLVEGTEHKFIANVPLRETYIRIAKDDTEIGFVDGNGAQPQYSNTNHLLVYPVNTTTMKIIFSAYYTGNHFVLIEPNLEQYAKLNDLTTLATKTELANLSNDVDSRLDQQDAVIQGLGNLEPSGVDTSTNILAFNEDKGIYVGSDTGHWYYWNGTQYADGGVYQATEIADDTITINKIAFKTNSSNLFNKEDLVYDKYVYYLNNVETAQANWCYTKTLIPVNPNSTIVFSRPSQQICFYDENEAFIGNPTWNTDVPSVVAPANARFIRISMPINYIDTFIMSVSNLPSEYKNGKVISKEFIENPYIDVEYGKVNHFDKSKTTDGYYIYYENGVITPNADWFYSDYIDIENITELSFVNSANDYQVCFYNSNNEFISGTNAIVVDSSNIPENAKYIRFSAPLTLKDTLMLIEGNHRGEYYDYIGYKTIKRDLIPTFTSDEGYSIKRFKIEILPTDDNTAFISKMMDAFNKGNCDVYINGTWDFSDVSPIYAINSSGLPIGKNNRYFFTSQSKIVCTYTGSDTNVNSLFSVFYNMIWYGDFEIHNLNIECSNIRYCIHDECGNESETTAYNHKYINCNMKLDNTNSPYKDTYHHCIGGGLGYNGEIVINNCCFNSVYVPTTNASDIQYHGNWANTEITRDGYSKLFVTNCYFEHTMSVSDPNTETKKKYLLFANNSCKTDIIYHNTSQTYWDVKKWGNDIRN